MPLNTANPQSIPSAAIIDASVHPSLLHRRIIHIDMDAFYASIEQRDRPELRGKPIIVGGSPESRGVVATASYEARKFGVRSAMACAKAKKLCPNGIFVMPRFEAYAAVSREIRTIFGKYTAVIEPMGLDEAFLDVTDVLQGGLARDLASKIRQEIFAVTGLTASAGIGPNKMVAKIATDVRKPNGQTVIHPTQVATFMAGLNVGRIPGVGPVTEKRLNAIGVRTCADLRQVNADRLQEAVGNWASDLVERAWGIDDRPLVTEWVRQSYGQETTFPRDLTTKDEMLTALSLICRELCEDLARRHIKGRTITLKVRYDDFQRSTRAVTLEESTCDPQVIEQLIPQLLDRIDRNGRNVRLLGLSVSKLREPTEPLAEDLGL